ADRTAKTGDGDYVAQSGTITFKPGETSKTITISIKGDKKKESDEYFFVNLSGASGAPIEVGKGEGWIYNDDDTPKPKKSKSQAQLYDAALAELVVGNSGRGIVETCVLAGEKKAAYPAGDFGFIHQRPNEGTEDTPCVKLRQSRWFSQ